MLEIFPDDKLKTVKNREGQLWRFSREFEVGDIVALPLKTQSAIAFGRITGPYQYRADAPPSAKHQRPVEWLTKDIPRSKIDSDLRHSLGGAMTVFRVQRNEAEKRIRAFLGGATPGSLAGTASLVPRLQMTKIRRLTSPRRQPIRSSTTSTESSVAIASHTSLPAS